MVSLICICNILDCLSWVIAHIDTSLQHLMLVIDDFSESVDRLDSQVDLLNRAFLCDACL